MIRIVAFLVILSVFSTETFSQKFTQTIRGKVTDLATNAPIPYVSVLLMNTNQGTTTDSLGFFMLKNVTIGRYNIKASMVSYEPYVMEEVQISSSKELFLNISLKESFNALSEVEIRPRINKEVPLNNTATLSAKMLSVDEARRYAGGFDDPARLVSSFAGVSSNVSNNAIVIRGNSPQSLQWKMEGIEIPNPNHFADMSTFGGGGLTALSSQLLANSDFFSGSMPAEYNNALSGVFDIFMRNGNNQKTEYTFQAGLLGIDASSEGPFRKGGRSAYLFNYRYSTLALLEPLMPENADGTTYQDLSFKLNFPTKKSGTFSLWGIGLTDGSGAKAKTDSTLWKYDSDIENQNFKQYMGAAGLGHTMNLSAKQFVKSTLAATINGINASTERMNSNALFEPLNKISNRNYSFVLSSFVNTKFNAKHFNKTGFTATGLMYDMLLKEAENPGNSMQTIVSENGFSTLLSAYTNSTLNFHGRTTLNLGINAQYFTLTGKYTLEPRAGIKYQLTHRQSLSFAYGLHSRIERLNYYFIKNSKYGEGAINQNLDFSKSHHFVFGWQTSISELLHLKIESYYQKLFNVPVIADSSFSIINLQNDWFFADKLQNSGFGENYGLDITLDKYLSGGYYFMVTTSLFHSQYKGGDGIWRDTRYNRNYAFNFLFGKEWQVGKSQKNVLGLNARLSYQGGDHYTPVNPLASDKAQEPVYFESMAFSEQFSPALTCHFTASYKINKAKSSHEISLKVINATSYEEFTGFQYNHRTHQVDEGREALMLPNLSYRIEF